ncbi:MAG: AAA family ATPase [Campylobacterota bacterium]
MATEYAKVARLFEDEVKLSNYFDSIEAESAKNRLKELIKTDTTELIFLIGDPGVGKSFLLKYLSKDLFMSRSVIYYDNPFFDHEQFLDKFIAKFTKEDIGSQSKKNKAVELAKKHEHTIFIDEAQLLSDAQVEFLRTLSDTKAFQIVMAMHKDEGQQILNKKHFKSRKKHVVELDEMQASEIAQYINDVMLKNSHGELQELFSKNCLKLIKKFTKGNLRAIKRMLQAIFELLDYKKQNGMLKDIKLDRCLLTMAAIDVGLIDA